MKLTMAKIIKPPTKLIGKYPDSVFLAGSIEMGIAINWQIDIEQSLPDNITVFNPRRDNWDPTWTQTIDNPHFREQVEWELSALEKASMVAMYFDPNTKSPISLLELGLFKNKVIVCCLQGFWRKGNVDIVCHRYDIPQDKSLDDLINSIKDYFGVDHD
jgi:hypothetical protein